MRGAAHQSWILSNSGKKSPLRAWFCCLTFRSSFYTTGATLSSPAGCMRHLSVLFVYCTGTNLRRARRFKWRSGLSRATRDHWSGPRDDPELGHPRLFAGCFCCLLLTHQIWLIFVLLCSVGSPPLQFFIPRAAFSVQFCSRPSRTEPRLHLRVFFRRS